MKLNERRERRGHHPLYFWLFSHACRKLTLLEMIFTCAHVHVLSDVRFGRSEGRFDEVTTRLLPGEVSFSGIPSVAAENSRS